MKVKAIIELDIEPGINFNADKFSFYILLDQAIEHKLDEIWEDNIISGYDNKKITVIEGA